MEVMGEFVCVCDNNNVGKRKVRRKIAELRPGRML